MTENDIFYEATGKISPTIMGRISPTKQYRQQTETELRELTVAAEI
jgi:hypothetical protein